MYQRILVPTDGSTTSEKGLTEAITLARLSGGRIRLVHVVDAMSVAVGADGLIIEVHPCPEEALCDGAQALTLEQYAELYQQINAIHEILAKEEMAIALA